MASMTPPHSQTKRAAFTLLEILLSVAILSMVAIALYQFVGSTMTSASVSYNSGTLQSELAGFNRVFQSQAVNLPARVPSGAQLLTGKSKRGAGTASDTIMWISPPGNGVFARRGDGFFFATLELLPGKDGGRLVLSRAVIQSDPNLPPKSVADVPLISNVSSFEIAYYDARINSWVDDWKDPAALPDLVRFRMRFTTGAPDFETIVRLPAKTTRS